jgi:hypothetical protein
VAGKVAKLATQFIALPTHISCQAKAFEARLSHRLPTQQLEQIWEQLGLGHFVIELHGMKNHLNSANV